MRGLRAPLGECTDKRLSEGGEEWGRYTTARDSEERFSTNGGNGWSSVRQARCSQLFFFSLQLESHDSMERRRRRRRCTEQLRCWWGKEETTPS